MKGATGRVTAQGLYWALVMETFVSISPASNRYPGTHFTDEKTEACRGTQSMLEGSRVWIQTKVGPAPKPMFFSFSVMLFCQHSEMLLRTNPFEEGIVTTFQIFARSLFHCELVLALEVILGSKACNPRKERLLLGAQEQGQTCMLPVHQPHKGIGSCDKP